MSGNGAKVLDLLTFKERAVSRADMPEIRLHTRFDDLMDATVVSTSGDELQVMHPTNYSMVELKMPADMEPGESVKIVDIDDVMYLVP